MRARDRARDARGERRPNAALQADAAVQRHRAKFGPYAHELNCGRGRGARRRCEGVLRYGASYRSIPNAPLPALEPLLRNKQVAKVISTYLGGGARFDGHVVLELSNGTSIKDYLSGYWHHDRCGRRLKLFIFLHDVKRDGRPTIVAAGARRLTAEISPRYTAEIAPRYRRPTPPSAGSHETTYFSTLGPARHARFTDKYVRAHYAAVPMAGPRGGGFLFDTNTLHVGMVRAPMPWPCYSHRADGSAFQQYCARFHAA